MLFDGHRIYGVATDDGHAMNEHCVGWVRVNAKNDVESILTGLQSGAFYSSCGPEIYDFYVENGVVLMRMSVVHRRNPNGEKWKRAITWLATMWKRSMPEIRY